MVDAFAQTISPIGLMVIVNFAVVAVAQFRIHPRLCNAIALRWKELDVEVTETRPRNVVAIWRYATTHATMNRTHRDQHMSRLIARYRLFWTYAYLSFGVFALWVVNPF